MGYNFSSLPLEFRRRHEIFQTETWYQILDSPSSFCLPLWCCRQHNVSRIHLVSLFCTCLVCLTQVRSLSWEDPLEKEMETHSSILAWRIPWTEQPGGLQYMGSQRVGHGWIRTHNAPTYNPIAMGVVLPFLCLFWTDAWFGSPFSSWSSLASGSSLLTPWSVTED